MCLSHIHTFLVLTLSLVLGHMSVALAADWTPLEVCTLIQEKYTQLPIPECTEANMKLLTKIVNSLVVLGFDPSKTRIPLSNLLKKTGQDQTPNDNQDVDGVNSGLQNFKASFLKLNFPLLTSSIKNIPNIKKIPQDLPLNFKKDGDNANNELTADNISRRQEEPQEPTALWKERVREFLRRRLPKNLISNVNSTEHDYSFMYDSLTFPGAMEKLYELQMQRYLNGE